MRKRNIQIKFWVSEEENDLIRKKAASIPHIRLGTYIRKMALDGQIDATDTSDIKAYTAELNAIGRNINQIARVANTNEYIDKRDIDYIIERLADIWRLQRRILSKQR